MKGVAAELSRTYHATSFFSGVHSSVTAGHDSHFNASTPVQTGLIMHAAMKSIGIELESRNVALGNNPCTPYDVCVKYFCGEDADIVHWEQTYFCADRRPIIEQFIRQALVMKSKPLVVFSDSHSGKWYAIAFFESMRRQYPDKRSTLTLSFLRCVVVCRDAKLCDTKPKSHALSADEQALLDAEPVHLVSELNKDELSNRVC
jgi:hypothetical protein